MCPACRGDDGVGWGYTDKTKDTLDMPIRLNKYWQRRFNADCNRAGDTARFFDADFLAAPGVVGKISTGAIDLVKTFCLRCRSLPIWN